MLAATDDRLEQDGLDPGSFRDRTARVFHRGGNVLRRLEGSALSAWQRLRRTAFFNRFTADGRLIETEEIEPGVLRHAKVPFVSYPYEWTFGMLRDAALLHLELLQAALQEDMILKDGSSYNVQWRGVRPAFIDIPSLVPLEPGQPWIGYRQFCRLFLFPLLLQAHRGVPFQPWLRGRLDGIAAQECNSLMSLRDLFRPGVFRHVWLQALLERGGSSGRLRRDLQAAGFHRGLIEANVSGLLRLVRRLNADLPTSLWARYEQTWTYKAEDVAAKEAFVEQSLRGRRWKQVWDLGCNTGRYTLLAAPHADFVLAIDGDPLAVEVLYQRLRGTGPANVLPLTMDLSDSSPAQGWRGCERLPLAGRGRPEAILCLALLHHLVLSANLPLDEVVAWLGGLTDHLVIEFPTRDDPMVRALLDARDEPAEDYDQTWFEACLARSFTSVSRQVLPSGTRILYRAERGR